MKGIFQLSETFIKIVTLAYLVIALFGMFFGINEYFLQIDIGKNYKQAIIVGDSIIGSKCLAVKEGDYYVKGLIDKSLISNSVNCFAFSKPIYLVVTSEGIKETVGDQTLSADLESYGEDKPFVRIPIAVKLNENNIKPGVIDVYVKP